MEICIQNNFFEIADIVREHVRLKKYEPDDAVNAREIVYYADKRVNHDRVVSLEERLEYLLVRYANGKEIIGHLIKKNFTECREVEFHARRSGCDDQIDQPKVHEKIPLHISTLSCDGSLFTITFMGRNRLS
jgi:hypothetical protein